MDLRGWLLGNFYVAYRLDRHVRRRFTKTGLGVLISWMAAAMIGVHIHANLASQLVTLFTMLLLISISHSLYFRPLLRLRRTLPPHATAEQPVTYQIQIENLGDVPQQGVWLHDELDDTPPTLAQWRAYRDPADAQRNVFDRWVGYPRWLSLLHRQRGADSRPIPLPVLPAGGHITVSLTLTPRRRGPLRFRSVQLARPDPFGLINAIFRVTLSDTLWVLPKRYLLNRIKLPGGRLYHAGGIPLATPTGDTEEFMGLREYRPGDSLRAIHWRSWAKIGKPIVQEKRPEYFTRHALILDTAAGNCERCFEEAIAVTASFLYTVDTHERLLDLLFVNEQAYCFTGGHGLGGNEPFLKILAGLKSQDTAAFQVLHQAVLQHAHHISGCVLVLLRWDEARQALRQSLQYRGIHVLTLIVVEQIPIAPLPPDVVILTPDNVASTLQQGLRGVI